jgi:predicted secreted protein
MSVVAGEAFEVVLADLPGAGYVWQMQSLPDGIEPLPVEHFAPVEREPAERDLLGGPEPSAHRYRATRPGSFDLVFAFVRPWQPTADVRQHRVRVTALPPDSAAQEIPGPPDIPTEAGGSS